MIFLVEQSDGIAKVENVVLGVLTVFFVMVIIGLVVKNRKLQTGTFFKVAVPILHLVLLLKERNALKVV